MPWCEDCAKFWNPSSMQAGGLCPTCQRVIVNDVDTLPPAPDVSGRPKAPWHFTLLVLALVIYLGYRAVQGVEWLIAHL